MSALAGIFVEPLEGAKRDGMKGAFMGFGKGIVGLVLKPVAGTLDLFTLTARGIANTPTTVYLKVNSILKKKSDKNVSRSSPMSPSKLAHSKELR